MNRLQRPVTRASFTNRSVLRRPSFTTAIGGTRNDGNVDESAMYGLFRTPYEKNEETSGAVVARGAVLGAQGAIRYKGRSFVAAVQSRPQAGGAAETQWYSGIGKHTQPSRWAQPGATEVRTGGFPLKAPVGATPATVSSDFPPPPPTWRETAMEAERRRRCLRGANGTDTAAETDCCGKCALSPAAIAAQLNLEAHTRQGAQCSAPLH